MGRWSAGLLFLLLVGLFPDGARADCSLTTIGILPLCDQPGTYLGRPGGLYPGGTNFLPSDHLSAGTTLGQSVGPRDVAGAPDPAGRIVLISIGMSNTTQEFSRFVQLAAADPSTNPLLAVVDGAQGGQTASVWADPSAMTWSVLDQRLSAAGVSGAQVQSAWVKEAERMPNSIGAFPVHADSLQADLATIAQNLKARFPNLVLSYYSSRTRAYTNQAASLNPEPFAFESAFAVRGLIADQLSGAPALNFLGSRGTVLAPWIAWGPYLWADGTNPRSDGFTWECADTQADFTHPSMTGRQKVAVQLLAFFKTDPTSAPWFLRSQVTGQAPTCAPTADESSGPAPLSVVLTANGADLDGTLTETFWTFGDGTLAVGNLAVKTFMLPGSHQVQLTVTDNDGNTARCSLPIVVSAEAPPPDAGMNDSGSTDLAPNDTSGPDSGSPADGTATDGGPPSSSEEESGCSCRASRGGPLAAQTGIVLGWLVALAGLGRRRSQDR